MIVNAAALMRQSSFSLALGAFMTSAGVIGVYRGDLVSSVFLVLGLTLLTGLFGIPFIWYSIRQRRDLVLAPVQFEVDEAGLSMASSVASSRQEWSVYRRADETSRAFFLQLGTGAAVLVPKRGLSDAAIDAFRERLERVGLLDRDRATRRQVRQLAWVAIGIGASVLLTLGPAVLARAGATASLDLSATADGGTVVVHGTTDLPDGVVIDVRVVQVDEWERDNDDGVAADPETSPWVIDGQAVVEDGAFDLTLAIDDWPGGRGGAAAYFFVDSRQPADVVDRFGVDGSGLRGPEAVEYPDFGTALEVHRSFEIPD
jgi:hypothetical protein